MSASCSDLLNAHPPSCPSRLRRLVKKRLSLLNQLESALASADAFDEPSVRHGDPAEVTLAHPRCLALALNTLEKADAEAHFSSIVDISRLCNWKYPALLLGVDMREHSWMDEFSLRKILTREIDAAGVSRTALSKEIGAAKGYLGEFLGEKKSADISATRLFLIARRLHLTVEQLFGVQAIEGHEGSGPTRIPKPGGPIHDPNEAAIIGVWRSADFLGRAGMLRALGITEVPSMKDLDPAPAPAPAPAKKAG